MSVFVVATAHEEPFFTYENLSDEIKNSEPKVKIDGVDYEAFCKTVEFVLWTANDNEYYIATTYMKAPDVDRDIGDPNKATRIDHGAVYVGTLAGHHVALLKTARQGHKTSQEMVKHLERFPNAKFIVSVGICYGFPQENVQLGDVIVSNAIADHGSARVNQSSQTSRGNRIEMHDDIKSIFCTSMMTINQMQVAKDRKEQSGEIKRRYSTYKQGLVVSGFCLIDNQEYRDQVYQAYADQHPLAGEMEGGILLTMQNDKRSVIVIKGVTDFADGDKKKAWQITSSKAALHFLEYQLSRIPRKVNLNRLYPLF